MFCIFVEICQVTVTEQCERECGHGHGTGIGRTDGFGTDGRIPEFFVWIETKESGIKNIGQVTSSGSLLSKTKKASITTVSPTKPTRIFFTAEDTPNVELRNGTFFFWL